MSFLQSAVNCILVSEIPFIFIFTVCYGTEATERILKDRASAQVSSPSMLPPPDYLVDFLIVVWPSFFQKNINIDSHIVSGHFGLVSVVKQWIRHDTTRHNTTRHDTTRPDTTRHGTTRHDTTRHDTGKCLYITNLMH